MLPASAGQSGNRVLKVHNVARRLGVSPRTVRWWAQTRQIPAFRIGVKLWGFYERDSEALRLRRSGVCPRDETRPSERALGIDYV